MIRVLPKAIMIATVMSTLFLTSQIEAYCSKCVKIEEERAKEQAANPQPFRYYDDQISLRTEEDNTSETGSGALKGSTYRSTKEKDKSSKPVKKAEDSQTQKNSTEQFLALNENGQPKNVEFFEEDTSGLNQNPSDKQQDSLQESMPSNSTNPSNISSQAYSTIYTIFKTKNFLETLDGSFTLFIPTNEAIQLLPPGTLMNLIRPENAENLAALVSNHIVAKKILKKDFNDYNNLEIKAVSGRNLTLSSKNGKLFIDNVQILRAEPAGYDGVIYVIDKVLSP